MNVNISIFHIPFFLLMNHTDAKFKYVTLLNLVLTFVNDWKIFQYRNITD